MCSPEARSQSPLLPPSRSAARRHRHGRLPLLLHGAPRRRLLLRRSRRRRNRRRREVRAAGEGRLRALAVPAPSREWSLRVRRHGRGDQWGLPRRRGTQAAPRWARLREVLPGEMQRRKAVQQPGSAGRAHRLPQEQPYRLPAWRASFRGPGKARGGPRVEEAGYSLRRVQENSLRLQGQEPVHTRGGREQASKQPGRQVPLPGRANRHPGGGRGSRGVVGVAVHGAGPRAGVAHGPGPRRPAAVPGRGHRRVRRQVGVGRAGGAPVGLAAGAGLRHRRPDRRRGQGRLPGLRRRRRRAGLEVRMAELLGRHRYLHDSTD